MKQIYVQAQADHIASLAKGAPLSALEELIWNALDADAREVRVDLVTNALGAVEAVRVADDGTGIDILKADTTFGSLGGSWKRFGAEAAGSRRRLHGRHGRGRFKAFALGSHVDWRTTVRITGELMSYVLSGDSSAPGVFDLAAAAQPGPGTGTEVYVSNASVNCDALLNTAETVQALAAKFALYLKSYPDIRIFFNGLPVTPLVVQRQATDYTLALENGQTARLEIIEWKCKFAGAGKLVFAGPDGFQLGEMATGVRSNGEPYTAYLVSPRLPELAAENALVMVELNPEVNQLVEAAKKALKEHFKAQSDEGLKAFRKEWKARLATFTEAERKALYLLLKKSLKTPLQTNQEV